MGGFDYYVISARINRLGAVSLSDNGTLLSFVSFDAQVDATQGPANGQTSTQIGSNGTDDTSSLSSTDGVNFVEDPNPSPGAPCFTSDTLILTDRGQICVQDIRPGDRVLTTGGTAETVRLVMTRSLRQSELLKTPELRPVCIVAGALGHGLPRRDLVVSRQHRMLVRSAIAQRMFATRDVLVSAIRLTELPGIFLDCDATQVTYHHLVFDRHVVLFAEGAPSESLFTGPEVLKSLPPEALRELLQLFPGLKSDQDMDPACYIPSAKRQKKLVARHIRNSKAIIDQALF